MHIVRNAYLLASPFDDNAGDLLPLAHLYRARLRRVDATWFEVICTTSVSTLIKPSDRLHAGSLTTKRVELLVGDLALGVCRLSPAGFERTVEGLADLDGVSAWWWHPGGCHDAVRGDTVLCGALVVVFSVRG